MALDEINSFRVVGGRRVVVVGVVVLVLVCITSGVFVVTSEKD